MSTIVEPSESPGIFELLSPAVRAAMIKGLNMNRLPESAAVGLASTADLRAMYREGFDRDEGGSEEYVDKVLDAEGTTPYSLTSSYYGTTSPPASSSSLSPTMRTSVGFLDDNRTKRMKIEQRRQRSEARKGLEQAARAVSSTSSVPTSSSFGTIRHEGMAEEHTTSGAGWEVVEAEADVNMDMSAEAEAEAMSSPGFEILSGPPSPCPALQIDEMEGSLLGVQQQET